MVALAMTIGLQRAGSETGAPTEHSDIRKEWCRRVSLAAKRHKKPSATRPCKGRPFLSTPIGVERTVFKWFNAHPHPSPLPRGEGEACLRVSRIRRHRACLGSGGQCANCLGEISPWPSRLHPMERRGRNAPSVFGNSRGWTRWTVIFDGPASGGPQNDSRGGRLRGR